MGRTKNYFVCKDEKRTIAGYTTVTKLESIANELLNIGIFIYHSSEDDDLTTYRFFSVMKENKPTVVIYANNDLDYTLVPIFEALNADIYKTEDILNDKNTLKFCLSKYNKSPLAVKSSEGDVQRLTKFIEDIKGDTSKALSYVNNPMWLAALNKSVQRVGTEIRKYEQATGQMVTVVQNIDETVQSLEANVNKQQEDIVKLVKELKEAEDKYKEATIKNKQEEVNTMANELLPNKNVLSSFSAYNAKPSVPYTLYIQVKKTCPYLLSFLYYYTQTMLKREKKNIKVLLLLPKGKMWVQYHDAFKVLNAEYLKFGSNEKMVNQIYWTSDPTNNFWNYVFKDIHNVDGFIVVDYIMDEILLTGSKITYMRAGLGTHFLTAEGKSNIPIENTIFSMYGDERGIVLKTIEGYESIKEDNNRASKYYNAYRDTAYLKMSRLLHIVK